MPGGIPGLESLFRSCYSNLVLNGLISLNRLVDLCCVRPATLMKTGALPEWTLNRLLGEEQ